MILHNQISKDNNFLNYMEVNSVRKTMCKYWKNLAQFFLGGKAELNIYTQTPRSTTGHLEPSPAPLIHCSNDSITAVVPVQ